MVSAPNGPAVLEVGHPLWGSWQVAFVPAVELGRARGMDLMASPRFPHLPFDALHGDGGGGVDKDLGAVGIHVLDDGPLHLLVVHYHFAQGVTCTGFQGPRALRVQHGGEPSGIVRGQGFEVGGVAESGGHLCKRGPTFAEGFGGPQTRQHLGGVEGGAVGGVGRHALRASHSRRQGS